MTKLWYLLAGAIIIAAFIQSRDKYFSLRNNKDSKERFFTFLLIILLATFCGLRNFYNDTITYLQMYEQAPRLSEFWGSDDASIARGIGFGFITSLIKEIGFSSQDYLMFYSYITVISYVLFVRKYCKTTILPVFLMFVTGFYTFSFAAIKQCVALAFCLWAVTFAIEKRWGYFVLLILLAATFHPYAIIYLIIPFFTFRPWTWKTYLYIVFFVSVGFFLDTFLDTIIDVTTMIGANYNEESFVGEGVNIFRVLVAFVPIILSFIYKRQLFSQSTREENIIFNMALLNALIMFVALFGTANYFARLANYFLPAQVVVLPWMFSKINYKESTMLKYMCVVGYTGYFYYENAILKWFDGCFNQVNLWVYLSGLLRW